MRKVRDEAKLRRARELALKSAAETTDEEDEALTAAAQADLDNPPLDQRRAQRLRPAIDVRPELVARHRAGRGPQKAPTKKLVSLRLDPDVLDHFRAQGPGWQARVNEALRKVARLKAKAGGQ